MSDASDFMGKLKPASFRGVPFGVTESKRTFGRRVALHEYPFRDVQWVEDLGRRGRVIGFTGFLVSNSLIYGGGDVLGQEQQLIGAAETSGPGKLVHPTLGDLNVTCTACVISDHLEQIGVLVIDLEFYEAGEKVFPTSAASTGDAVKTAAQSANEAASSDAGLAMTGLLGAGPSAFTAGLAAATSLAGQIGALAGDATNLFGLAALLPGSFGRFFNGANVLTLAGDVLSLVTPYSGDTTIGQLVAGAAQARAAIASAVGLVETVAGNLGLGASNNTPADLAAAAQGAVQALSAAAPDPANSIRLLMAVAGFVPPATVSMSAMGSAVGDVFRRAAVVAMAQAAATYQPRAYDDAVATMTDVAGFLDDEIDIAGDEGDDASFSALRALRVAMVQDLTARGASLARITTVTTAEPMPALALAQSLYRDATRADQLVRQADPENPLFMPTSFNALAA